MSTASPEHPDTFTEYVITLRLRAKTHPLRWMPMVMEHSLQEGEKLYTTEVREA